MASVATASMDLLDPRDFATRDDVLNFLMTSCGWSTAKVGEVFELSDRQARRIKNERQPWRPAERAEAPALTRGEAEMLLRDVAINPYTSPAERELVEEWVTSHAQANGIAELSRIKFRHGVRIQPKARNGYGQGTRAGQTYDYCPGK